MTSTFVAVPDHMKQLKTPINKMQFIYTLDYYSALAARNYDMLQHGCGSDKNIMLSKLN